MQFNELGNISSWLFSNKLVLNTNKTSYMIFFSNRLIDYDSVVVTLDDKIISRSHS